MNVMNDMNGKWSRDEREGPRRVLAAGVPGLGCRFSAEIRRNPTIEKKYWRTATTAPASSPG
jgi:hypothetical protein